MAMVLGMLLAAGLHLAGPKHTAIVLDYPVSFVEFVEEVVEVVFAVLEGVSFDAEVAVIYGQHFGQMPRFHQFESTIYNA